MKIVRTGEGRGHKPPGDASRIVRSEPPRRVPRVDPAFFLQNDPRKKASPGQEHARQPEGGRDELNARLRRSVEALNRMIARRRGAPGIRFEVDEQAGRAFAVVRERATGEVIRQIPASLLLELAARLKESGGLWQDFNL